MYKENETERVNGKETKNILVETVDELEEEEALPPIDEPEEKEEKVLSPAQKQVDAIEDYSDDEWEKQQQQQQHTKPKRLVTAVRIPNGWSVRPSEYGMRGPLPTCQGCKGRIKRDAICIRHKFMKRKQYNYFTIYQYHCKVPCLEKVDKEHLKRLTQKHWTDKRVTTVVKKLDKKLGLSP